MQSTISEKNEATGVPLYLLFRSPRCLPVAHDMAISDRL